MLSHGKSPWSWTWQSLGKTHRHEPIVPSFEVMRKKNEVKRVIPLSDAQLKGGMAQFPPMWSEQVASTWTQKNNWSFWGTSTFHLPTIMLSNHSLSMSVCLESDSQPTVVVTCFTDPSGFVNLQSIRKYAPASDDMFCLLVHHIKSMCLMIESPPPIYQQWPSNQL